MYLMMIWVFMSKYSMIRIRIVLRARLLGAKLLFHLSWGASSLKVLRLIFQSQLRQSGLGYMLNTILPQLICYCFHFVCSIIGCLFVSIIFIRRAMCWIMLTVYDFQRSCKAAQVVDRDFVHYTHTFPSCHRQTNTFFTKFDCGIYVMIFLENFDGKIVKKFDHATASKFRKLVAYKLITSPLNEVDISQFKMKP
uniref:Ubiquitin-like protease family profile domain-containing protein n=1 Tax=Arundo donax TaxID=35708 RepID=A0A0A9CLP3_ARUDO